MKLHEKYFQIRALFVEDIITNFEQFEKRESSDSIGKYSDDFVRNIESVMYNMLKYMRTKYE